MNERLFLMLNPLILLFVASLRTLHDNLHKTKLCFLKAQSLWKPICFSLNETGVPSQLSRCHFSWQLQDTLFTRVVECSTEGHLSFFQKPQQKTFLLLQKVIYLGTSPRCHIFPSERQQSKQVIWDMSKTYTGKERLLFQFKKHA